MSLLKTLFNRQPVTTDGDKQENVSRYQRPDTDGIHPICHNWEPTPNKPAYVIPLQQWSIVIGVHPNRVQVRLSNGKIQEYGVNDVSCTDADNPNVASVHDDDGDKITIGYGVVDGDKLFWIDTPHESVTFRVDNPTQLREAITQVLR